MNYTRFLNAYSDHRNLEAKQRGQLFQGIAALIEKEYGGIIIKQYLSVLYFAKKFRRPV